MTDIDQQFVRDGRSIGAWMLQLVSADTSERRAAENAVSAMFYGLPTADGPFELSTITDVEIYQAAFYRAIRAAAEEEAFPAHGFVPAAVDRMIEAHRAYLELVDAENALMDEWMEHSSDDPLDDPGIAGRMEVLKQRKVEEQAGRGRMSFGDQTLCLVFEHLGRALLAAPGAVRRALADRVVARRAAEALKRVGPAAVQFADTLVERLDASTEEFHMSDALGAIGRGAAHVVDAMIARVREGRGVTREGAISTLGYMGPHLAGREDAVIGLLIDIVRSPEHDARYGALQALGSVGREREDALEVVLEVAAPRPARTRTMPGTDYEYDEAMLGRGMAISALGYFARFGERVTPMLADALNTFQEFDPDQMRDDDGGCGRVMDALRKLGPGAAGAAGALADRLRDVDGEVRWGIVRALGRMGPPAAAALPALERLRRELYGDEDGSVDDPVAEAIRQIGR
jgi:hypothetical protein